MGRAVFDLPSKRVFVGELEEVQIVKASRAVLSNTLDLLRALYAKIHPDPDHILVSRFYQRKCLSRTLEE